MKNDFTSKSNAELRVIATQMGTVMGLSPSTYGVTAAQVTSLGTFNTTLGTDGTAVEAAKATLKAAVETQFTDRKALITQMSAMAKLAYNKPCTPAQIASAGLAVHDTSPSPIYPVQPTGLAATPFADGTVKLKWAKNNPYGVNYFIEASIDGGTWTQVYATKRGSITLSGFAPGVPTAFRVKAENRNQVTLPSNEAEIYPTAAPEMALRFAA